jgi:hypothetical protein
MTKYLSLSLRGASLTAFVVVAGYSLIGCGGGGSDDSAPTPTPTPTATATPTPTPTATPVPNPGDNGGGTPQPTPTPTVDPSPIPSPTPVPNPIITTPSGLRYQDIVVGNGAEATPGTTATVHYIGSFTNGDKFQEGTFPFVVGAREVVAGFDEGVIGMKVGGKRMLYLPANLAYGATGSGPIPPNTPINFEVELKNIQ